MGLPHSTPPDVGRLVYKSFRRLFNRVVYTAKESTSNRLTKTSVLNSRFENGSRNSNRNHHSTFHFPRTSRGTWKEHLPALVVPTRGGFALHNKIQRRFASTEPPRCCFQLAVLFLGPRDRIPTNLESRRPWSILRSGRHLRTTPLVPTSGPQQVVPTVHRYVRQALLATPQTCPLHSSFLLFFLSLS